MEFHNQNKVVIKCKNYEICDSILPVHSGNYLCTTCHINFGTWGVMPNGNNGKGFLPIYDNVKCSFCLESKRGIVQPKCDHLLCIGCFKNRYFGDRSKYVEPLFPYPDIEDDYYDDQEIDKWNEEYPLIKTYTEEWNDWDEKYCKIEEYLAKCPLCLN
ncbi:MAG: hypothetical protein QM487_02795 [Candidatus Marithrix sp.]